MSRHRLRTAERPVVDADHVQDLGRSPSSAAYGPHLAIRHKRTRPYKLRINGKVERFVQTALREWAYARTYDTLDQRRAGLPAFLFRYNWHRPHGGINGSTPISRLGLTEDNLLSIYT